MNKTATSTKRIRFNDCDMFAHLNNSSYIDYLMNAREDHLREQYQFNLSEYYKQGKGWVVTSHEILYLRPALYNETVTIQSTLLNADEFGLQIEVMMMNQEQNQVKALLRTGFIHVNTQTAQREAHGTEFLNWIKGLVNEDRELQMPLSERAKLLQSKLKSVKADK